METLRKILYGIVAVLAIAAGITLVVALTQKPKPAPGTAVTHDGLTIRVNGTCANNGVMTLVSSGFTAGGKYRTEAWYPNGEPYTYMRSIGNVVKDSPTERGATDTPAWEWDCRVTPDGALDPEGVYTLTMTDLATKRKVTATFEVKYH